jgi:hypothetical protein
VWLAVSYFSSPGTQLNDWAEETLARSANYGGALLFITYFYDRYGLDALHRLSTDPASRGLEAVDNVLREMGEPDVNTLFADWVMANIIMNAETGYGYRSLPRGFGGAAARITASEYPLRVEGQVNQYAADYIVLTDLEGVETLDITVQASNEVALLATKPHSGQQMWYSNRGDVSNTTLTRAFDLSGVESATLSYAIWHDLEDLWDYGYVMVSDDGGTTWTPLAAPGTTTDNPYNTAYGPGAKSRCRWMLTRAARCWYASR